MSLPRKEEKGYLEVRHSDEGLSIQGQQKHVDELESVFAQHGIPCRRGRAADPDAERLVFGPGVDAARVAEVLESYKIAKGS